MKLDWRDVSPGEGNPISTSLTSREAEKLEELAAGAIALEIGSAYGYSAVKMGKVAKIVHAVDPHVALNSLNTLVHNLHANPPAAKHVSITVGTSQEVMPRWDDAMFNLVFIDGDHAEHAVTHDITQALRLVRPGGVIAVHDYNEDTCPAVAPVCDRLLPGGELVDTLWVWRKPKVSVERD